MKVIAVVFLVALLIDARFVVAEGIEIREDDDKITISTPQHHRGKFE